MALNVVFDRLLGNSGKGYCLLVMAKSIRYLKRIRRTNKRCVIA